MIIVTGGAGFIGSAIVWKLNSEGINDILIVDNLGTSDKWKNLINRSYFDYMHKDKFLRLIEEDIIPFSVDALIHMGACSSTTEQDADYLMENNFHYTCTLAKWAEKKGCRFIYASSAATYGNGDRGFSDDAMVSRVLRPINMYGYSKQLFDLWVFRNHMEQRVAGIKFFNVFGPNEYHKGDMRSVVNKAFAQIKERGKVRLFKSHRPGYEDGEQKRDFIYVKDCVDVIWWLLNNRDINGIFNLGTGKARSWNDLARAVFAAMEKKPVIEYIDMPESIRNQYQYFTEAEMNKIRNRGWLTSVTSLEDAVSDYVTTYLEQGETCLE